MVKSESRTQYTRARAATPSFAVGVESGKASAELPESVEGKVSTKVMNELALRFNVPRGKVSQIMGIMNFLQSKFQSLDMEIRASNGSLSVEDYSNKIKEALRQLGIDLDETK